jgi:hypothetical protein
MGEHGTGREGPSAGATASPKVTPLRRAEDGTVILGPSISLADAQVHRETADAYAGELFRLGRYRVAVCRDGIQWLFQRQRPAKSGGGAAWDTLGYCATRKGLMRLHRAHIGPDAPEIAALPEQIERRASAGAGGANVEA